MKMIRDAILIIAILFISVQDALSQSDGQTCSIDVKGDNNGTIVQNNNDGDVYITFIDFDVKKDQLILTIASRIKNTQPKEIFSTIEQKKSEFKTLPLKSPEAVRQLEIAKTIILPEMAKTKSTICFDELIRDAVENGKIEIQKADSSFTRLVLGDAEELLKDFVIRYEEKIGIQRIKENSKYYYQHSGYCIKKNNRCIYFDFASDFFGFQNAIAGDRVVGLNSFEYYFIYRDGSKKFDFTFDDYSVGKLELTEYILITLKNKKKVLYTNDGERFSREYTNLKEIKIGDKNFLKFYENGFIGLIGNFHHNYYNDWHKSDSSITLLRPDSYEDLTNDFFSINKKFDYDIKYVYANAKLKGKWHLIQLAIPINAYKDNYHINIEVVIENLDYPVVLEKFNTENESIVILKSNGKYGLLNIDNNKTVFPDFNKISNFDKHGFATLTKNNINVYDDKYNINIYVDKLMQITNDTFNSIKELTPKYSIINFNNKVGLIKNTNKKTILLSEYDKISFYENNCLLIEKAGLVGLKGIDTSTISIAPIYQSIKKINSNKFIFEDFGRWGIVDKLGVELKILHSKRDRNGGITKVITHEGRQLAILFGLEKYEGIINSNGDYIFKGKIGADAKVVFHEIKGTSHCIEIIENNVSARLLFFNEWNLVSPPINKTWESVSKTRAFIKYRLVHTTENSLIDINSGFEYLKGEANLIEDFNEFGYFWIKDLNNHFVLYNEYIQKVKGAYYDGHGEMNGELIVPVQNNTKWGFVQIEKNNAVELIKYKYTSASKVINDYTIVTFDVNGLYHGVINMSDYIVIPFIFMNVKIVNSAYIVSTYYSDEFTLKPGNEQGLKRFKCISGDCDKYEKLAEEYYKKR